MKFVRFGLLTSTIGVAGFGLWVLGQTSDSHQAKRLAPVISLPATNSDFRDLDLALRNPLMNEVIDDDIAVERSNLHINQLLTDLAAVKGSSRVEVLRSLVREQVKVNYFYEDVIAGRINSRQYSPTAQDRLAKGRRTLISHVTELARTSKSNRIKARALYSGVRAQFLSGNTSAAFKLRKIEKYLPGEVQGRSQLMRGFYGNSMKHTRLLKKARSSLSPLGKVYADLMIGRQYAGLSKNLGQTDKKKKNSYRKYVYRASKQSVGLSKKNRSEILSYGLNIWRNSERRLNWNKPPLYLKGHKNLMVTNAIIERRALGKISKSQLSNAISDYRLVRSKVDKKYHLAVNDRILNLLRGSYKKTKVSKTYEREILANLQIYKGNSTVESRVGARYRALTFEVLALANRAISSDRLRNQGVKTGLRFVKWSSSNTDKIAVKEEIAKIYARSGNDSLAVKMYDNLIKSGDPAKKGFYLKKAVSSQTIVAKWSKNAPWKKQREGSRQARQKLFSLYSQILSQPGQAGRWDILAHMGLLKISTGQGSTAFNLWQSALEKGDVSSNHARYAAGMMIAVYHKGKRWDSLVKIADLCLNRGIKPLGSDLKSVRTYLADGLFLGGKKADASGEYKKSWQYLKRFDSFKGDKRRDEGGYLLGKAYHKDGQHTNATAAYIAHVGEFKVSNYRKAVLLNGGLWAMGMAHEDEAIYFYQIFSVENGDDKRSVKVRNDLINLYMGRQLYGSAARTHQALIRSEFTSEDKKLESALAYMDIEERYGSKKLAAWGAKKALEISNDDVAVAEVLAFQARKVMGTEGSVAKLRVIEKQMVGLDTGDARIRNYLGSIRLGIADELALNEKEEVFNIGIENHHKVLDEKYRKFLKAKSYYDQVCEDDNSYCAPAMYNLSKMTRYSIETISEISIPDTLDKSTVDKFNGRKNKIVKYLAGIGKKSNQIAYNAANSGNTTPEWAQDIIWNNTDDWNFESIQDDASNTFVQWRTAE